MSNWFLDTLSQLVDPAQAYALVGLIVANVFTGVFAAMLNGTFTVAKLADFWKRAAMIFIAYIAVSILALAITDWQALQTTMWAFLIAFMAKKISANLAEMGLPDVLSPVDKAVNGIGLGVRSLAKPKQKEE